MGLVCAHGSDGRGRNLYRKTDPTLFMITERQIWVTYGYIHSLYYEKLITLVSVYHGERS